MEIIRKKVPGTIFLRWLTPFFIISCIAYAGSLDDIRKNTTWQEPKHSSRNSYYTPQITPQELISHLSKYHKDTIKMEVLFEEVSSRGLDKKMYSGGAWRRKWSSKRYIAFTIKDPKKQIKSKYFYMFILKNNPDADKLYELLKNAKIIITGMVKDIEHGSAWIEVSKIDL